MSTILARDVPYASLWHKSDYALVRREIEGMDLVAPSRVVDILATSTRVMTPSAPGLVESARQRR